jgi:predicted extracellular nuclease
VVDAVVYDTNDGDDTALLAGFGQTSQFNEAAAGDKDRDSNQRCPNGTGDFAAFPPTPGIENVCVLPVDEVLISDIQGAPEDWGTDNFGNSDVSPLDGRQVMISGVVVGDFEDGDTDESRNLRGFFVQEETTDEDEDASTSEGIFVFEGFSDFDAANNVALGDVVEVVGTVDEFFGETQIDSVQSITVLSSNNLAAVSPATISLPAVNTTESQDGDAQPDLEAYEGMWVVFEDTLTVTEQFQLDRFNEIKLVQGLRPFQFTQRELPSQAGFEAHLKELGKRRITYDDGLSVQNANVANLDGFGPAYSESVAVRMGDEISGLTGILDYKWAGNSASGATWRVRSSVDGSNVFTSTAQNNSPNPRPLEAPDVEGNVKVASFNVLNFFTTLRSSGSSTAIGMDPRGAWDQDEFDRQLPKLVNALVEIDADVLGLVELENEFDAINDGSTAIEVLVNAVNAELGAGTYDYVVPGRQFVGTDAIAVGVIYKPGRVQIPDDAEPAVLDDEVLPSLPSFGDAFVLPVFDGESTNRASLAVTFKPRKAGEKFTVVVNHFKSKGPSGAGGLNVDQGDGAGAWNERRLDAAEALLEWLRTYPTKIGTDQVIILGDLNAYAKEDPVRYLLENGFNNSESPDAYSYTFDGQIGTLDYLLFSDSLMKEFRGGAVWHINADEADALDYNLDFGRSAAYYDGNTPTRNSDHDPVIAGFMMGDNGNDNERKLKGDDKSMSPENGNEKSGHPDDR